jgi:hypothetical protein
MLVSVIVDKDVADFNHLKDFIFYGPVLTDREVQYLYQKAFDVQTKRQQEGWCNRNYVFLYEKGMTASNEVPILPTDENPYYRKIMNAYMAFLPEEFTDRELYLSEDSPTFRVSTKIALYKPGDHMDWHADVQPTARQRPGKYSAALGGRRIISSITYLNDNFEGGHTVFRCGVDITPKKGWSVIFPSDWAWRHKGEPVTKGIKKITVQHIHS